MGVKSCDAAVKFSHWYLNGRPANVCLSRGGQIQSSRCRLGFCSTRCNRASTQESRAGESLPTCGIENLAWLCYLRTGSAHPWFTAFTCVSLLVCLPHCVITLPDVEHRGQCSPGSVGVQTSGSTNHRSLSGPLELWVMLFFSLKCSVQVFFFFYFLSLKPHIGLK